NAKQAQQQKPQSAPTPAHQQNAQKQAQQQKPQSAPATPQQQQAVKKQQQNQQAAPQPKQQQQQQQNQKTQQARPEAQGNRSSTSSARSQQRTPKVQKAEARQTSLAQKQLTEKQRDAFRLQRRQEKEKARRALADILQLQKSNNGGIRKRSPSVKKNAANRSRQNRLEKKAARGQARVITSSCINIIPTLQFTRLWSHTTNPDMPETRISLKTSQGTVLVGILQTPDADAATSFPSSEKGKGGEVMSEVPDGKGRRIVVMCHGLLEEV
ncbi:hypothetical protein HDU67_001070, partial [Dinochytrium kinnereticum]